VDTSKFRFQFVAAGDYATYKLMAYGHDLDGTRLDIHFRAAPLYYAEGKKRLNYSEADYQKWIVDTCGYLTWHRTEPVPFEIVKAFNAHLVEQDEAARRRYPDLEMEPIQLAKGRCYANPENWSECIIEDLPE
jgi:hypothetical protein